MPLVVFFFFFCLCTWTLLNIKFCIFVTPLWGISWSKPLILYLALLPGIPDSLLQQGPKRVRGKVYSLLGLGWLGTCRSLLELHEGLTASQRPLVTVSLRTISRQPWLPSCCWSWDDTSSIAWARWDSAYFGCLSPHWPFVHRARLSDFRIWY